MYKITHYSLFKHKKIKWLILFGAVLSTGTLIMVWLAQPYYQFVGLPIAYFGLIWALNNISVGLFSKYAIFFENRFGKKQLFIALPVIYFVSVLGIALVTKIFGILLFFSFTFIRSINRVILTDYINSYTPSETRATVMSINSFMGKLIFSAFSPLIGLINDKYTLPIALYVTGISIFAVSIISLHYLHKHKVI